MQRDEWVDEVVRPWKNGDELQVRGNKCQELKWCDIDCTDPIYFGVMLRKFEYRIKPRVVKYLIETEHYPGACDFGFVADAMVNAKETMGLGFPPPFIQAMRDAKRVDE